MDFAKTYYQYEMHTLWFCTFVCMHAHKHVRIIHMYLAFL